MEWMTLLLCQEESIFNIC